MHPHAVWLWSLVSTALLLTTSISARAEVYLTEGQALTLACGEGVKYVHRAKALSPELQEQLDDRNIESNPKAEVAHFFECTAADGKVTGYALIDAEVGKHLPITYVVAFTTDGEVRRTDLMVFREVYGWEVRERPFMDQFSGKRASDNLAIGSGLKNVSGATLSARSLAKGVKRALFLWHHFYGQGEGK